MILLQKSSCGGWRPEAVHPFSARSYGTDVMPVVVVGRLWNMHYLSVCNVFEQCHSRFHRTSV